MDRKEIKLKDYISKSKIKEMKKFFKDKKLSFFDLETTGLKHDADKIIQFSISTLDLEKEKFIHESQMLNPAFYNNSKGKWEVKKIHEEATKAHGYTNSDLAEFPKFHEVANEIMARLEKADYIVTFNGYKFDIPFLISDLYELPNKDYWENEKKVHKWKFIDVSVLYRKLYPKEELTSLDDIFLHFDHEKTKEEVENMDFLTKVQTMLNSMVEKGKTLSEDSKVGEYTSIKNFFYHLNQEEKDRYTLENLTNIHFPDNKLDFHDASNDNLATLMLLSTFFNKYYNLDVMYQDNMKDFDGLDVYDHRLAMDLLYKEVDGKKEFFINFGGLKGKPVKDLLLSENFGKLKKCLSKDWSGFPNRNYHTRRMVSYLTGVKVDKGCYLY